MTKDELRTLGVPEENIDRVIGIHHKELNALKDKHADEVNALKANTESLTEKITGLEALEPEKLKEQLEAVQTELKNMKAADAEKAYQSALDKVLEPYTFSGVLVKSAVIERIKAAGLKPDNGFLGVKELIEGIRAEDPTAIIDTKAEENSAKLITGSMKPEGQKFDEIAFMQKAEKDGKGVDAVNKLFKPFKF